MSPADTKKREPKELLPEMRGSSAQREKDLDRAQWLTTLAGKLLQEADELRNKWGAKHSDGASAQPSSDSVSPISSGDGGEASKTKGKRGFGSSRKAIAVTDVTMGGTNGVPGAAGDDEPVMTSKQKKSKAKKSRKATGDTSAAIPDVADIRQGEPSAAIEIPRAGKSKTSKSGETKPPKDAKRKRSSASEQVPDDAGATAESSSTQHHQAKDGGDKAGKGKDSRRNHVAQDTTAVNAVDKWNVTALEGGSARQSKFMKLLGGGKAAASSQNPGASRAKVEIHKIQDDLQKQFDAGLRMKFDGQGQKKGLGA